MDLSLALYFFLTLALVMAAIWGYFRVFALLAGPPLRYFFHSIYEWTHGGAKRRAGNSPIWKSS